MWVGAERAVAGDGRGDTDGEERLKGGDEKLTLMLGVRVMRTSLERQGRNMAQVLLLVEISCV